MKNKNMSDMELFVLKKQLELELEEKKEKQKRNKELNIELNGALACGACVVAGLLTFNPVVPIALVSKYMIVGGVSLLAIPVAVMLTDAFVGNTVPQEKEQVRPLNAFEQQMQFAQTKDDDK